MTTYTTAEVRFAERKPLLVREAAAFLVGCDAKVLKLEYAGSVAGCAAATEAAAGVPEAAAGVPWAVLSAGVEYERFLGWLRDASLSRRIRRVIDSS